MFAFKHFYIQSLENEKFNALMKWKINESLFSSLTCNKQNVNQI
ncbi:hypothetical protein Tsp_02277 [Trichinella spiralis]|nr:hypothetical protein Tsp_02277 [Trichinella spiralis]